MPINEGAGRDGERIWLEPYPDALLDARSRAGPPPGARYGAEQSMALAFIGALQRLEPVPRAALLLRDVLGFTPPEVADMLGESEESVEGCLGPARARLENRLPPRGTAPPPAPDSEREGELVARFASALERRDARALAALLTPKVRLTMPPQPGVREGPLAVRCFLLERLLWRAERGLALVATRANRQPALAYYVRDPQGPALRLQGLLVLTLEGDRIAAITRFGEGALRPLGLRRTLPELG